MDLFSDLSFCFPLMRGLDVRAVQLSLARAKLLSGPADGVFGPGTALAVRQFQQVHGLKEDGIVGRNTWSLLFSDKAAGTVLTANTNVPAPSIISSPWDTGLEPYKARLAQLHEAPSATGAHAGQLTKEGVKVDGKLPRTGGEPKTVAKTWASYRASFEKCAAAYGVPVELLVATACTESGGRADRVREEPKYVNDVATPDNVSARTDADFDLHGPFGHGRQIAGSSRTAGPRNVDPGGGLLHQAAGGLRQTADQFRPTARRHRIQRGFVTAERRKSVGVSTDDA